MNRMTIAEALSLPRTHWDHLSVAQIDIPPATWQAVGDAWVWLRGLENGDEQAVHAARCEVLGDGGLIMALLSPAATFLAWFKAEPWDCFDSGQDGDDWAWAVIDRVRCVVARLGPMSERLSLVGVI